MAQLHIYLCCGGGLSSGFLAQKARAAAKKSKVNATIEAKSESEDKVKTRTCHFI